MMTEGGFYLFSWPWLLFIPWQKWLQISAIGVVALISAASYNFKELFGVNHQWMMILAAIPIVLYNGEKAVACGISFIFSIQLTLLFLQLLVSSCNVNYFLLDDCLKLFTMQHVNKSYR